MNTLTKTSITAFAVMSITFGSAFPTLASSITGEKIIASSNVQRQQTKVPATPDGFTIEVIGGSTNTKKAMPGTTVTATASTTPEGKYFAGWTSNCTLDFSDPSEKTVTFTMPSYEISIQAHFDEILPQDSNVVPDTIVAYNYRNTFKMENETLSVKQKTDGVVLATLNNKAQISKNGIVQSQIAEADLKACIAIGKEFTKKNDIKYGLAVEVKLPVGREYNEIVVKFPQNMWSTLLTEGVSSFSVASREGTILFNQSAITAMSSQNRADSRLTFEKKNPNTPTERTSYKLSITYEGQGSADSDIGNLVMPTSGISVTIPFELKDEKNASKVTVMGVKPDETTEKAPGSSYKTKLEAVTFPIGIHSYYTVGF